MEPTLDATPDTNKWLIAITAMAGSFMAVMDISVVNVAMPHMMGNFAVDKSAITWVATSYSIAEIITATMAGWWVKVLGRKRLYLISYLIFIAGSILGGTARSFEMMVVFRVIQGFGGGALIPLSQAMLREAFPREEQGMAMAIYGMGVVLAPGIGAILGGYLTDRFGWPFIFYINVPVCVVGIILTTLFIDDPPYLDRGIPHIDWGGIILLGIGLTGMQIVLERGQEENWFASNLIIVGTAVTIIALVALVFWELRAASPIVNFRILKNIPLSVASTIGVVFGIGLFGTTFILPQFTQDLLGYPAFQSGMVLFPRAVALFVFMPVAGRLYNYVDPRLLVAAGLALLWFAFYQLSHMSIQAGVWTFVPALLLMGAGMPFVFVTLSTVALSDVPKRVMTDATSLFTLSRRIGGNIGYALAATIVARRVQFHHARLSSHVTAASPAYRHFHEKMAGSLGHTMSPVHADHVATAMAGHLVQQQATVMSYNDVAFILGLMFLVTAPLVFLLPGHPKTEEPTPSTQPVRSRRGGEPKPA